MTGFLESPRFPDETAAWLVGGRGFRTVVTETYSGDEYRIPGWTRARGQWDVGEALRTAAEAGQPLSAKDLYAFFMVAQGQLNGFRVKAPLDNSDDGHGVLGATGLAVAATLVYQMFKNYPAGAATFQQPVFKPVGSSIKIYDNGVLRTLTTHYTIDATTGLITFVSQPTVGHTLTWIGDYDVPVRFAGDEPMIGLDSSGAMYNMQGVKLIELRTP